MRNLTVTSVARRTRSAPLEYELAGVSGPGPENEFRARLATTGSPPRGTHDESQGKHAE